MDGVKSHHLYQGLNWERLEAKLITAPWVPDAPAPFPEPETPNMNDVYTGDQVRVSFRAAGSCGVSDLHRKFGHPSRWEGSVYPWFVHLLAQAECRGTKTYESQR